MDSETARILDRMEKQLRDATRVVVLLPPIQFRLPTTAEAVGRTFVIKNSSDTTATNVVTTGSDTFIDTGTGSISLAPLASVHCYSTGNHWVLL